ncbi:gas vesicle structural protein GvpA [Streptomyces sp. A7024]|uniref:Gas vesicle protein A n=1 Tax=Streptomyces coryli TaxID=1128680 RepID=A0A6G4TSM8_9ACTN|nr:gas vesicle structural protein GvpA [Streptomyces coryli]NGN62782.1 gas vesicle structural protein GvpA [Streptomyces coryli]
MTVVPAQQGSGGSSSSLYDVLELILDRGLVIDAFIRVSVVGIELLKIDIRIVVASVDTYLRFAEAVGRLDLEAGPKKPAGLPELPGKMTESGARGKTKGALSGAAQTLADAFQQARDEGQRATADESDRPRAKRAAGRRNPEDE